MDALELVIAGRDPKKIVAFACGKCGIVARTREEANRCCDPRCADCHNPIDGKERRLRCASCERNAAKVRAEERQREEIAALRKAKHIPAPEWTEFVIVEGGPGSSDGFYDSVETLREAFADEGEEPPAWVWGTYSVGLTLDAQDVINNALESQEHHEDAGDWISGTAELQEALDAWVKEHASRVETWWADRKVAVILDSESVAQILAEPVAGRAGEEAGHG